MWEDMIGNKLLIRELENEYSNPIEVLILNVRPVSNGERVLVYTGRRESPYWLNPAEFVVESVFPSADRKSMWFKYLGKKILISNNKTSSMEEYEVINVWNNFALVHKIHNMDSIKCWINIEEVTVHVET